MSDTISVRLHHARVRVEELKFAVGDEVPYDEGPLANAPKPFSPLQIGQLGALSHREAEDVGGVGCLGRLLLVDDLG